MILCPGHYRNLMGEGDIQNPSIISSLVANEDLTALGRAFFPPIWVEELGSSEDHCLFGLHLAADTPDNLSSRSWHISRAMV